jgi:hypothetical protein
LDGVRRIVLARKLAARKDEVASGELALGVPLHQQNVEAARTALETSRAALEAAGGAIAKEHEGGSGHRNHARRFDGHGVV